MAGVRSRIGAILCAGVLAGGCSSAPSPSGGSASAAGPSAAGRPAAQVQQYLDAVNRLCDALLPKVEAVTDGGRLDIPLKDFFAQLPAHARLRADFDRQLAQVPVPASAREQARALAAYIRFANELDARRLTAAKQGRASYEREIRAELRTAAGDPSITARTAAGFHESCNAR